MIVVVTGASGSGKSEYAEGVAVKLAGKGDLYYLATMRVYGEEGVRRVERHRKLRAGKDFKRLSVLSRWMKRLHRYACQSLWNRHVTHHMEEYVRQNF